MGSKLGMSQIPSDTAYKYQGAFSFENKQQLEIQANLLNKPSL